MNRSPATQHYNPEGLNHQDLFGLIPRNTFVLQLNKLLLLRRVFGFTKCNNRNFSISSLKFFVHPSSPKFCSAIHRFLLCPALYMQQSYPTFHCHTHHISSSAFSYWFLFGHMNGRDETFLKRGSKKQCKQREGQLILVYND